MVSINLDTQFFYGIIATVIILWLVYSYKNMSNRVIELEKKKGGKN